MYSLQGTRTEDVSPKRSQPFKPSVFTDGGEWRSGYEIGSYRICNICGKEDS